MTPQRKRVPIFCVRLYPTPQTNDAIRALRSALKTLLRRHGLKCLSVEIENAKPEGGKDD
jgi:hypothetical protein